VNYLVSSKITTEEALIGIELDLSLHTI